ncbi:MAG: response regulator [Candidatus Eremiobacteraeota bacterium]|nr:response regulator [Candidatus Eremiobacteraeota bacterium]
MRVLLIDDDGMLRKGLTGSLARLGIDVEPVACANEAMQRLRRQPYDALVCDVVLPGTDGLSLIQGLRREGFTLPCHVISKTDSALMRAAAWEVGAQSFFPKPVNHFQLGATLTGSRAQAKRALPKS